ncbi:MAG: hypothetical protein WCG08_15955 [Paludibacter sp.]
MKTSTFKSFLVVLGSFLVMQQSFAVINTYIVVKGAQSFDQMWLVSIPTCTSGFDNGWDGFKMIASSASVQLYAAEAAGNFQIDAIPDFNNTYIAFKPGADTEYTLTFTNQTLEDQYQQLYLIDSVANKIVNIYATGTQYTFTASPSDVAVKRFKIVTSDPTPVVVVVPVPDPIVVVVDPVVPVVDPVVPPVVVVVPPVVVPPVVPVVTPNDKKDKDSKSDDKDKKDHNKKLNIYSNNKTIVVENISKQKGDLKLYNVKTGRMVKIHQFKANGTTSIATDVPTGTYVANGATLEDNFSTTLIIR